MSENAAIVPIRSTVAAARSGDPSLQEVIIRVGRVTRDRLDYVARMTEQAASRVLNATEAAGPLQASIDSDAARIAEGWRDVPAATAQRSEYRAMAERTLEHLVATRAGAGATRAHLLEIMMAQDFQDLTGQGIKRITELVQDVEQQLVPLLLEFAPPEARRDAGSGLLNGPQVAPHRTSDVVADQAQVDDPLESLGF